MYLFDSINKRETLVLFLGDIAFFYVSLWVTLFVRFLRVPENTLVTNHMSAFSILFIVWIAVFFIAGLYEKHTLILRSKIPSLVLSAQVMNSALAVLFFYLIPYFGITPKTNLFIYLFVSFVLIVLWRLELFPALASQKKQRGILIGSGEEMRELRDEVNHNPRYNLEFISSIDLEKIEGLDFQKEIISRIYSEGVTTIVVDTRNEKIEPILPSLYNLIFSKVRFIDMHKVYEDTFDRIPLSLVRYSWFLENISTSSKFTYDFLKRIMDILIAFLVGVLSLVLYPFVCVAIKLDDGGEIFTSQERIGRNNVPITLFKFRTMSFDDGGRWQTLGKKNQVTRVGALLRRMRIDELPQLWNVLFGTISLIGPRPEFPEPVKIYERHLPYYNIRHLIKPGLSGWAQIYHDAHPHHAADVGETRVKLSYDLYYIKNRSFFLDLKIALKTIKTLLQRAGR